MSGYDRIRAFLFMYVGYLFFSPSPTYTDDSGKRPIKSIACHGCDIISIYRILFIVIKAISHAIEKKKIF